MAGPFVERFDVEPYAMGGPGIEQPAQRELQRFFPAAPPFGLDDDALDTDGIMRVLQ